jgi:hypothetical protein
MTLGRNRKLFQRFDCISDSTQWNMKTWFTSVQEEDMVSQAPDLLADVPSPGYG